jgi:transposase InsO family protein
MIAFFDDASRRLMGWAFLTDKKAISTREVLETTLDTNQVKPYSIWSDNGTEFKGAFQALLQERNIYHVHTAPRNPHKTGKWNVSGRRLSSARVGT